MAQTVEYFEDNIYFTEGPFVVCNPMGNGWRIEVEQKNYHTSVLPDASIMELLRITGKYVVRGFDRMPTADAADWLNSLVNFGQIVLDGNCWVVVDESPVS